MVDRPAQATPERLLAAVRADADYLSRVIERPGSLRLHLPPGRRSRRRGPTGGYGTPGATYALLEAYDELGTPLYLEKAELALGYLKAHLGDDPGRQGKYVLDTNDEEQQKAGGAGLALLAFAKDAAVTGKRTDLETMRSLARFIMQASSIADGHFRANADLEDDNSGKKRKREPVYYQGEAALGLLRLYALDPQPAYLDAARRAADWVVHVRDADVSQDNQEHDHWMSYALNDLYRVTRDDAYLEHAYKIARAIQSKQHRAGNSPAPDLVGTFYDGADDAGVDAARGVRGRRGALALRGSSRRRWLIGPAREVAASMLGQQFDADNDYWLSNPAKAAGRRAREPLRARRAHRLRAARDERLAAPGARAARSGVRQDGGALAGPDDALTGRRAINGGHARPVGGVVGRRRRGGSRWRAGPPARGRAGRRSGSSAPRARRRVASGRRAGEGRRGDSRDARGRLLVLAVPSVRRA